MKTFRACDHYNQGVSVKILPFCVFRSSLGHLNPSNTAISLEPFGAVACLGLRGVFVALSLRAPADKEQGLLF